MNNVDERVKGRLYIIDDVYPHPRSVDSWRGIEFNAYLDYFSDSKIFTSMSSIGLLGNQTKKEVLEIFYEQFPRYAERTIYLKDNLGDLQDADMVYMIFLNNAWENLGILEEFEIPFVFELYPGGGFAMNNEDSDKKLKRVMGSCCFRGVIVSGIITYQYLLSRALCQKQQILFVQGCVLNNDSWKKVDVQKKYYGIDKKTFDIAFAAYRYSEHEMDKGYDVFIQVAKKLHKMSEKYRFHVVGNFDSTVLDNAELGETIKYYGVKETDWFNSFYQNMDVFISPNRVSVLNNGSFDGFPTGCGIDAIVRKTVLIATDELNQNNGQYRCGEDIYIVNGNPQIIVDRILFLCEYPHILEELSEKGCENAKTLYSYERQLKPRIGFLNDLLRHSIRQK